MACSIRTCRRGRDGLRVRHNVLSFVAAGAFCGQFGWLSVPPTDALRSKPSAKRGKSMQIGLREARARFQAFDEVAARVLQESVA